MVSERLQKAKEQINTGNWHYVRHSEDVELLATRTFRGPGSLEDVGSSLVRGQGEPLFRRR